MDSTARQSPAVQAASVAAVLVPVLIGIVCVASSSATLAYSIDDTFYYTRIAEHIAAGHGSTYDGMEATNGYHPLWQGVLAVLALVTGAGGLKLGSLALGFSGLLTAAGTGALLTAPGIWRGRAAGAALAFFATFYGGKLLINGLESAAAFLFCALFVRLLVAADVAPERRSAADDGRRGDDVRQRGPLAALIALAALLPLARIECVALTPLLVLFAAENSGGRPARDRVFAAAAFAGVSALSLGAWFIASYALTGAAFPVSGAIKIPGPSVVGGVVALLWLALAALVTRRTLQRDGNAAMSAGQRRIRRAGAAIFVWYLLVAAANALLRGRLLPEFWYGAPAVAAVILLAGSGTPATPGRRAMAAAAIALLVALSWAHRLRPRSLGAERAAVAFGHIIADQLPADARIAGWDVGIVAAASGRQISQLGGLVHSLRYKEECVDTGELARCLAEDGIDWIVQYIPCDAARLSERYEVAGLGAWNVVIAETASWQSARSLRAGRYAFTALHRGGAGPSLESVVREGTLCQSGP